MLENSADDDDYDQSPVSSSVKGQSLHSGHSDEWSGCPLLQITVQRFKDPCVVF